MRISKLDADAGLLVIGGFAGIRSTIGVSAYARRNQPSIRYSRGSDERALADAHQLGGVLLHAARRSRARAGSSRARPIRCSGAASATAGRCRAAPRRRAPRSRRAVMTGPVDEHDRALDRVLQLAHVARPVVAAAAPPARRRRRRSMRLAGALRVLARRSARRAAGMSSRRSRSGGSSIGMTLRR